MRGKKMKALQLAGVVLGLVLPSVAFAHGPTRQKTTQTIEVNAPAAKVWALIGNFQNMDWADDVAKTTGTGGNEPNNATRVITLKSGATLTQDLTRYDAATMSYGYFTDKVAITTLPVNDYSGEIQVKADGPNKSTIVWEAAFYRGYMNNDPPPNLSDSASLKAVNLYMSKRLSALKAKLDASH
jgi:Polyketide cyclase / dehydrase and lipid transport